MFLHIRESHASEAELKELRTDGTFVQEFQVIERGLQDLLCTMSKLRTALCQKDRY